MRNLLYLLLDAVFTINRGERMTFDAANLLDWRDREFKAPKGILTFRLYDTGWLVRFTPFDAALKVEKVEDTDIIRACGFANEKNVR